ncbi:MAG: hypothetical protein MZV63_37010 [Marinilabiliales bacterium]|nr:hypothetical protein [Marinilabiliales bacterium]
MDMSLELNSPIITRQLNISDILLIISPLAEYPKAMELSYEGTASRSLLYLNGRESCRTLRSYRKNNLIKTGLLKGEFYRETGAIYLDELQCSWQ